jgi:hypothetical protein
MRKKMWGKNGDGESAIIQRAVGIKEFVGDIVKELNFIIQEDVMTIINSENILAAIAKSDDLFEFDNGDIEVISNVINYYYSKEYNMRIDIDTVVDNII